MKTDKEQKPAKLYLFSLLGITLIVILYTVVGFWALPPLVKSQLEKNLSEKLHREVSIETIRINPFELSFSVKGFVVKELNSAEKFLAFDELSGVVQGGSIVARALIMREVRLTGPYVKITVTNDHRFNFSDLLTEEAPVTQGTPPTAEGAATEPHAQTAAKPPSPPSSGKETKSSPFRFSIHNVQIVNGGIDYSDEPRDSQKSIRNIHLELPLISRMDETEGGWTELTVTAKVNQSPLSVVARAKPFPDPAESVVDIDLKDFDLSEYQAYLPPQLRFKLNSGLLDAKARATYALSEGGPTLGITGEAVLNRLEVVDLNDLKLVALPRLEVSVASLEPLAGRLHLSKVQARSPELHLWRTKDGNLNVQTLVAAGDTGKAEVAGDGKEPGFRVEVDEIEITDGMIGFTDHATEPEFRTTLESIDLKVNQFSSTPDAKALIKMSGRTEIGESLGVEGHFSLAPFRYEGSAGISAITFAKYAPYYRNQILFDVMDGRLELKARMVFEAGEKMPELKLTDLTTTVSSLKLKKERGNG